MSYASSFGCSVSRLKAPASATPFAGLVRSQSMFWLIMAGCRAIAGRVIAVAGQRGAGRGVASQGSQVPMPMPFEHLHLLKCAAIAALGVDYISIGALTHSVRALDLSLDITVPSS